MSTCSSVGPWVHMSASVLQRWFFTALGFASMLSFQVGLIRGLKIDTMAYIYQPLPFSLMHSSHSVKKTETLIILRAPPYSKA
jgi:hypothetical protein